MLWLLAKGAIGQQLLKEDEVLRGKITAQGLNAVIPPGDKHLGEDWGKSVLWLLAKGAIGQQLLKEDAVLRSKITAEGLNAVMLRGEDEGKTALFLLAANPEGLQLLIDDAGLRGQISDGLKDVIFEGPDAGKSLYTS